MFTPEAFSIQSESDGQVHRLTPSGELDIATAPLLQTEFEAARDAQAEKIVVDLSRLTFIDSTGLALALLMAEECKEDDRLRIVNDSPTVDRLIDLTGIRDNLPMINSADDPLAPLPTRAR